MEAAIYYTPRHADAQARGCRRFAMSGKASIDSAYEGELATFSAAHQCQRRTVVALDQSRQIDVAGNAVLYQ